MQLVSVPVGPGVGDRVADGVALGGPGEAVALGGSGVAEAVQVGCGELVLLGVRVAVGQGVKVAVGLAVAVGDGEALGVSVWEGVTVGVAVELAVAVGVSLGVDVCDGVRLGSGVGGTTKSWSEASLVLVVASVRSAGIGELPVGPAGGRRLRLWMIVAKEGPSGGAGSPSIAWLVKTRPQNVNPNTTGTTISPAISVRRIPDLGRVRYPTGRFGEGPVRVWRAMQTPPWRSPVSHSRTIPARRSIAGLYQPRPSPQKELHGCNQDCKTGARGRMTAIEPNNCA